MNRLPVSLLVTLCVALFLASLSVVAWRQGRAREVMADRERVIGAIAMEIDERARLLERIRYLESRGRVTKEAEQRLGLAIPSDSSIVFLSGVDQ
jgi:hypothetical protein